MTIEKGVPGVAMFDQPWTWLVVFHRDCSTPWLRRLIPGEFKHVSALGFSSKTNTWVFFDPAFERTRIFVCPDSREVVPLLGTWMANAVTVSMNVQPTQKRMWRPGGWCVPAIAHLLGIRSRAVLPGGLLRDCLRNGGRIIHDASQCSDADARSDAASAGSGVAE